MGEHISLLGKPSYYDPGPAHLFSSELTPPYTARLTSTLLLLLSELSSLWGSRVRVSVAKNAEFDMMAVLLLRLLGLQCGTNAGE